MQSLTDFLNDLGAEFPDEIAGKGGASGFDGPPLPEDRQYRARISRGEWRQAQNGNWSFSFTFEIIEPAEFAGRKFSEYYSKDGSNQIAKEKFAKFIGESGIPFDEIDKSSDEAFAASFEDATFVIATRTWGDQNDRTGIRYLNRDRGQALQEKIAPAKKRGSTSKPLRADISVNKDKGPTEESTPVAPRPPVTLPGGNRPSGVTLPPGLQRPQPNQPAQPEPVYGDDQTPP